MVTTSLPRQPAASTAIRAGQRGSGSSWRSRADSELGSMLRRTAYQSGLSSANPNAMMFDPAATAKYCLLSNMYVIGHAFQS